MRVLTVRQPWAGAIIFGGKDVENRTRSLGDYKGPVAIHTSLRYDADAESAALGLISAHVLDGLMPDDFLTLGRIIGVVDLVSRHQSTFFHGCRSAQTRENGTSVPLCSPWAEQDHFHYVFANPRPLVEPIAYRGGLSLRTLPDHVAAAVMAGVSA